MYPLTIIHEPDVPINLPIFMIRNLWYGAVRDKIFEIPFSGSAGQTDRRKDAH